MGRFRGGKVTDTQPEAVSALLFRFEKNQWKSVYQASVVQTVFSAIPKISLYPVDDALLLSQNLSAGDLSSG